MNNTSTINIKQEIEQFVIQEFSLSPESLEDNDSLIEEGWLDSYGVVKLVMFMEKTFGIRISLEEINPELLDGIESISKFVSQKISELK